MAIFRICLRRSGAIGWLNLESHLHWSDGSGAPNENIVQNHFKHNIVELILVFKTYRHIFIP